MILLVPHSNFSQCAEWLSTYHLGQQIKTACQIAKCINLRQIDTGIGIEFDACLRMWSPYPNHLHSFILTLGNEWYHRTHRYHPWVVPGVTQLNGIRGSVVCPWLVDSRLHINNKSRLLFWGLVDTLKKRARLVLGKDDSIRAYLMGYFGVNRRGLDSHVLDIMSAHSGLDAVGAARIPSWYEQWGWDISPSNVLYQT